MRCRYAIQRSRALNFKLSVTKSEVIELPRLCARLRLMLAQVRRELYTAANVAALNRIRAQLQSVGRAAVNCMADTSSRAVQALEQSKLTLQRSEQQLRSYREMGTGGFSGVR